MIIFDILWSLCPVYIILLSTIRTGAYSSRRCVSFSSNSNDNTQHSSTLFVESEQRIKRQKALTSHTFRHSFLLLVLQSFYWANVNCVDFMLPSIVSCVSETSYCLHNNDMNSVSQTAIHQ